MKTSKNNKDKGADGDNGKRSRNKSAEHHQPETDLARAVLEAAEMGDILNLKACLEAERMFGNPNVNRADSRGCIPLHFAVASKNLEVVRTLVDYGANVNHKDRLGFTALFWATGRYPSVEIAKYLLEDCKASVDVTTCNGVSPLHGAAIQGNIECIELLVKYGADARCKDDKGNTPLDLAKDDETKSFLYKALIHQDLDKDMKGSKCFQCGVAGDNARELKRCARCFFAKYCGKDCQAAHWTAEHRKSCPGSVLAVPSHPLGQYSAVLNNHTLRIHTGVPAEKQPDTLRSKKFIVKVQIPYGANGGLKGEAMMVYNEDRSVTGYITSQEKGYPHLFELITREGWMSIKAFFWAELPQLNAADKKPSPQGSVKVFHGQCAQYQDW